MTLTFEECRKAYLEWEQERKKKLKSNKPYHKPKYAQHTNDKLELDITRDFDDIKYMMRKEIDTSTLTRKQLEELHEQIKALYWLMSDCMNLRD